MPASANVLTLSQTVENLNGKHDNISSASSSEDVSVDYDVHAPSYAPLSVYPVEKKCQKNTPSWFASLPDKQRHSQFLKDAVDFMLEKAVFDATNRSNKVVEWKAPEELLKLLDLDLSNEPVSHDRLLQLMEDVTKYSVKTGHPFFINQLFSSVDPYGLVGQWLGDALNPSVYTYEVSPVFTLMEETVLSEMRHIVGFPNGQGDGIFCPGGSIANGYAISCARYKSFPEVKTKGLHSLPRLVVFTSEDAHYSIKKLASFLGLGSDNVYLIRTDARGKMDIHHLEQEIERSLQEGAAPFMVSATAGTTVLGAFDPLPQIADLCSKYNLWMHVDAAWGGGALVSKKHRYLLDGIERMNTTMFLAEASRMSINKLKDIHTSAGKGTNGLVDHIDKVFDNAAYFTEQINKREGFRMVLREPECTNVCFWYIPPSLRGQEDQPDFKERLHKVAPKIKERMIKEGSMMVTYQPLKDHPNFFRLVLQNSGVERSDMDYFVREFERLGGDL
ncbi:Cysteine sulfinic acid decarboxylase [Blattella germanica]|nr:Cysteine sulfinic acid decarboxylase [Blattella germanica]